MRESFLSERIAMMIHDAGMPPEEAIAQADICWQKYARMNKLFRQEQRKI